MENALVHGLAEQGVPIKSWLTDGVGCGVGDVPADHDVYIRVARFDKN
jgi:hypothetical protein